MAKDGSNRGGARTGAGRKKKGLTDKVAEGKTDNLLVLPTTNFSGVEIPPPKKHLKAPQKNGQKNYAVEIYGKSSEDYRSANLQDDVMERLLRSRKG